MITSSAGAAVQGGGALGAVCRQPPRAGGAAGLPRAGRPVPPARVRVLRGLRDGVDAAFRAALAHSACGPDEVFVGCAFGQRARRCRAEGLFASAVVPEGIPPRAALARRTLWLVKRSSLVVLFPERPADRQWGPGSRLAYRSALYHLKPT